MADNDQRESYSFLTSAKERRSQYRTYSKYYDKRAERFGQGMTAKLSYKSYVAVRKEDIANAKKLGVKPPSNKALAYGQQRIGNKAARDRRRHAIDHIQDAINREKEGKPLDKAQRHYLEEGTYWGFTKDSEGNKIPVRRIKKITLQDIINETGVQRDIYEALVMDEDIETVDFYGYVA